MRTRMANKLEAIDVRVGALENSLKNHGMTMKEHLVQLTEHSTQLGSLMTSVSDITRSLPMLHFEMRGGF